MKSKALIISIQPKYIRRIINGKKRVELRKCKPHVEPDTEVLMYSTSPVCSLVGGFQIEKIITCHPSNLWDKVHSKAGLSRAEYEIYYQDYNQGVGIFIKNVWRMHEPISLAAIRELFGKFYPPQNFSYLSDIQLQALRFHRQAS